MSQRATISPCLPASLVSLSPLPPTPMQAKRTFSLGGVGRAVAVALALALRLPPPRTRVLAEPRLVRRMNSRRSIE